MMMAIGNGNGSGSRPWAFPLMTGLLGALVAVLLAGVPALVSIGERPTREDVSAIISEKLGELPGLVSSVQEAQTTQEGILARVGALERTANDRVATSATLEAQVAELRIQVASLVEAIERSSGNVQPPP